MIKEAYIYPGSCSSTSFAKTITVDSQRYDVINDPLGETLILINSFVRHHNSFCYLKHNSLNCKAINKLLILGYHNRRNYCK